MIAAAKPIYGLPGRKGMTLLEVLLAVSVLAMVVSMVSLSLSGSLNVVEATRTQGELYYRAQVVLQRISEDLASSALIDGVEFVGIDAELEGLEADTLEFLSSAHVVFDPDHDHPGMAIISYTVVADEDNEGEFLLLRGDELLTGTVNKGQGPREKKGYLLSDRLRSISFIYVDEEGEEHDTWDTEVDPNDPVPRKLPVSVICIIEFWVDRAEESSLEFTTRILLPVGLINVEKP